MGKHFSFIHCADLHLGEPFGDVRLGGSGPWNEQISKSTFKAFEKVVDAAIDNRVDAILVMYIIGIIIVWRRKWPLPVNCTVRLKMALKLL